MNSNDKRIINRYIREIRHLLPVIGKSEKRFLSDLRQTIDEYYQTTNSISFDTLIDVFGEPKDLGINYIAEKDAATLRKELNWSKYIRYTFYAVLTSIILLTGFVAFTIYLEFQRAQATQIDHEVIVIKGERTIESQ